MKQIAFLIFLFIASAFHAYASDYNYLIFQQTDGTEQAFGVSGLKLTFENGNMLVQQNGVTSTFPLSQLSKMFFSGDTTGIEQLKENEEQPLTVFSPSGVRVGVFSSPTDLQQKLPRGVYMMKQGDKTIKVYIK